MYSARTYWKYFPPHFKKTKTATRTIQDGTGRDETIRQYSSTYIRTSLSFHTCTRCITTIFNQYHVVSISTNNMSVLTPIYSTLGPLFFPCVYGVNQSWSHRSISFLYFASRFSSLCVACLCTQHTCLSM